MSSLAYLVVALSLLQGAIAYTTLTAPTAIYPDSSGTTSVSMTIEWKKVTIGNAGTFWTRCYYYLGSCHFPGPTMYLKPGGKLSLTVTNNLGSNPANDPMMNYFRMINATNVHTHGLHADPSIDSVFVEINPNGGAHTYNLPLVSEHHPGTHWYHDHMHGASTLHVMGGLFGMLIVQAGSVTIPTELTSITQEVLLIHPLKFASDSTQDCTPTGASFDAFRVYSFDELETNMSAKVRNGVSLTENIGVPSDFIAVNGQYKPTITFQPGQSKYLRILFGSFALNPTIRWSTSCTGKLVAIDGVYLDTPRTVTSLYLIPARRFDVVMTCSTAGNYNLSITDTVSTFTSTSFMFFNVSGTSTTGVTVPSSLTSITKPYYLQDMTNKTATNTHSVGLGGNPAPSCQFSMSENGVTSVFVGERGTTNRSLYSHVSKLGDIEQWTISAGAGGGGPRRQGAAAAPTAHPLHIHVNHFQIVTYNGDLSTYNLQLGDFVDSIPAIGGMVIRFRTCTYTGETIFHCHILSHEDRGLMSAYLIVNATSGATHQVLSVLWSCVIALLAVLSI